MEAQLREVEESIRRRHPDSVSNLIRAAQPDSSLVEELVRKTHKIEEMEKERADLTEEFQKKLRLISIISLSPSLVFCKEVTLHFFSISRALKQEHERLRFEQEKRMQNLKLGLDGNKGNFDDSSHDNRGKVVL